MPALQSKGHGKFIKLHRCQSWAVLMHVFEFLEGVGQVGRAYCSKMMSFAALISDKT